MKTTFLAKIELLRPTLLWIREQLKHLDTATLRKIELASEETIVNIIHHARPENIEIELKIFPKSHVEITFKDAGPPFNPLQVKPPDQTSPLEEREPGGLGIHLIRQTMDEVRYKREGNRNILTLIKRQ